MQHNNRSNSTNPPNDITPLNGQHAPDANFHLDGLSVPLNGDFSTADFDHWSDFYAEIPGQVPEAKNPCEGEPAQNDTMSATTISVDGTIDPVGASGNSAITVAGDELLPSAGFITPSKLSYYTKLAEAPRLDLDFIKAEARAGGADGERRVGLHHSQLCGMARAGLRQTLGEKRVSVMQNLKHLDDDILRTRRLLGGTRQFDDVPGAQPALNWTGSDRLGALLLGTFSLAGVGMDFFTWATILRQNDAHFYHNPALAFFFGAVPLAFPLSLKVLLGGVQDENGSERTLRRAAWCGVAASLATITFFTLGHDGLSEIASHGFGPLHRAAEASASFDWKPVAQKASSVFLMIVASLFSAMCGHLLAGMFKRRRRASRVANPQYLITARKLARLQAVSHEERETLGAVTGKLNELAAEEGALVGSAVNYYRDLRSVYQQTEQRLGELLNGPGCTPQLTSGKKLKKGGQFLAIALAALGLGLSGCDRGGASGSVAAQPRTDNVASQVVFGLTPGLDDAEREQVFQASGELAMRGLPPGGSLEVWDAYELHRICAFTIPADSFYAENPAARLEIASSAMQELQTWLNRPAVAGEKAPHILLPQFIEQALAPQHRRGETAVLIAGSALYTHPRDNAWNLVDGKGQKWNAFFNDGHLTAPPEITPFSVGGREQALAGVSIHYAYLREDSASEAQRQGLTRFYALWVKSQHGTLATMTRDIRVALDNLRRGLRTPVLDPEPRAAEDKPEMREIRVERVQRSETLPATVRGVSATSAIDKILVPISDQQRRETPPLTSPEVQELTVGARWSLHLDIDVHGVHHPGATELFYGCPRSLEGVFTKDWQDAPPGIQGFEKITFSQPANLRDVRVALNLYRGTAPQGADVTLKIIADGKEYERTFHIRATEGNRGANSAARARDPHWLVISPEELAEICGLR